MKSFVSQKQGKNLTLKLVRLLRIFKLSSTQKIGALEIDEKTRKRCYGDYGETDVSFLKAETFLKFRFISDTRESTSSKKIVNMDSHELVAFINSLDKQMPVELF